MILVFTAGALICPEAARSQQGPNPNPQYSIIGRPAPVAHDQAVSGIKQALLNGAQVAVRELGHENGFLTNLNVRIPMPKQLHSLENTMRLLKQDQMADELVATMNHAAERAVPEAASVLGDAISRMTLRDAEAIVGGPPDAATQYFRQATETNLFQRFLPIVRKCTAETGVTATYKRIEQAAMANKYLGPLLGAVTDSSSLDLDAYITEKSLDGLFKEIAAEEQRIRQDPVARTTELLRRVFGGAH